MTVDKFILVKNAPWLGLGVMTAIYIIEKDVERLACIGIVKNVQSNGLVQISLETCQHGYRDEEAIWSSLNRIERKSILVKPGPYTGNL